MERVEIVEVGPRDGLQNLPRGLPVADRLALILALVPAGFARIEVASFVDPARVPQMADSDAVLAGCPDVPGLAFTALVANLRGLAQAEAAGADAVAIFASASEGFSRANLGRGRAEVTARFARIVQAARVPVRGYVSCVTDCPYDGPTPPQAVARAVADLLAMGVREVALGETLGRAGPAQVAAMLEAVLRVAAPAQLAGHFHDTGGRALAAVDCALEAGLRIFDASIAGLGGCPFAPGAAGNLATETLAAHLAARGFATGLDAPALARAARCATDLTGALHEP